MWNNLSPNWICSPKISCLINWGRLFCFLKESFPIVSVLGNVTTMSLKNHNRQFLRSEGKSQHKRNLNQTRIYKPMPSLVNQPLLFAFCAAELFYTSQGLGFVSVFLMKLSFQTERQGKETKQVQIYTVVAQTQSCTTGSILPGLQGAVVQCGHCQCGSPVLGAPLQGSCRAGHGQCGLAQLWDKGWRARWARARGLVPAPCNHLSPRGSEYIQRSPSLIPPWMLLLTSQSGACKWARAACYKPPVPIPKTTAETAELPFKDRRGARLSPF